MRKGGCDCDKVDMTMKKYISDNYYLYFVIYKK